MAFDVVFLGAAKGIWLRIYVYIIYPRKGTERPRRGLCIDRRRHRFRARNALCGEKFHTENSFSSRGVVGKYIYIYIIRLLS